MIDDHGDEWVTIPDAARRLRVRESVLYNWRSRDVIAGRGGGHGRTVYINLTDAQAAERAWRQRTQRRGISPA